MWPNEEARVSFILEKISVEFYEEFFDIITRFFIHIARLAGIAEGHIDREQLAKENIAFIDRVYPSKQKYNGMLSDAKHCTNGEIIILDIITDFLKN